MGSASAITVIVTYNDDVAQLSASLKSLSMQGDDLDFRFIFTGQNHFSLFDSEVRQRWPHASIVTCTPDVIDQITNAIITASNSEFVTFLTPGDVYRPERIRILHQTAIQTKADILLSYAELLNFKGRRLTASTSIGRSYNQALLSNIAAHPSLSFVLLWFDVLLSPGNLFFSKRIFAEIGGFNGHRRLSAFDFLLRAARCQEPTIIPSTLISCRAQYLSKSLTYVEEIEEERATIIRSHLLALLSERPKNYACDVFRSHPFMFAGVPWSQALADAVDALVEFRPATEVERETPSPLQDDTLKGRHFNLLTHELSLTGAPVIILEMASLLIGRGATVMVISPTDGPLRESFEDRGIDVRILPNIHQRLIALERFLLMNQEPRTQLIGFAKWVLSQTIGAFRRILKARGQRWLARHMRGPILVNSVAAWEWAYQVLRASRSASVSWYIHETFDPKWMVSEEADRLFKAKIRSGALKMLYGSDATRGVWHKEGYPGVVRYWSGISISDYAGHQTTATSTSSAGKVILNVGTVGARKGTRTLLEAFALCRMRGTIPPDAELRIVGCPKPSGNQEARDILFRALQPDLKGSVKIFGSLQPSALPALYDEADVYVQSSFFDCMPISILTAMARGMPIVATNVDGCGEAIANETSGLLVPPRDPERLAQAIARTITDSDLTGRIGRAARETFERKLSVESTLNKILESFPGCAS